LICNLKIQIRKGSIFYNTTNGITTLREHVNDDHSTIAKMFEVEVNSLLKGKWINNLPKKSKSIL
jgi:hypothetical protein